MTVGIIGAGSMARTHHAAWRALGEDVVGVYGGQEESTQAFSRDTGVPAATAVEELISRCDIVDVCSPTTTHHQYVTLAVAAKKPVFCEKPLARTLDDARDMVNSARVARVPLGVGLVLRFFPEYAGAAETARSGELGELAVLRFSRCTFAPKRAWYNDEKKSGGVILDLMIHDLDFARHVAGPVHRVFASVDRDGPGPHAYAILSHSSGAITHVEASWRMPQPTFTTSFEIAGSKALLENDSVDTTALLPRLHATSTQDDVPEVPVAASPVAEDPYTAELRAFRDALVAGAPLPVDGHQGIAALQLALAAIESDAHRSPVDIPAEEEA